MQNSDTDNNEDYSFEVNPEYSESYDEGTPGTISIGLPALLIIFLLSGFWSDSFAQKKDFVRDDYIKETKISSRIFQGPVNIISEEDLADGLLDTVYTDKENWLELRIHEQMVYVHWRNGKIDKYPVSTGNKFLDKGLESRPGIFAIFVKTEHHQSSQFDNADMYHFMPFNQGIGFHSINGTGYYQHLGVRPSSHGCIRMKHDDVKKLFGDVTLGTIVLAHKGSYARTVAFAPKDYDRSAQTYTPEEYKRMLAENLYNVLSGKYYVRDRNFFVVDPAVIPKSGIYIGYDREIPKKQEMPRPAFVINYPNEALIEAPIKDILFNEMQVENKDEGAEYVSNEKTKNTKKDYSVSSTDELVKKYFSNPIGVLPYYPPTNR